jgi:hypothetical protein
MNLFVSLLILQEVEDEKQDEEDGSGCFGQARHRRTKEPAEPGQQQAQADDQQWFVNV